MLKVVKFGGTSLATAEQILKVKAIIDADPARRVVIPSAPGKAHSGDTKVTDLLYKLHEQTAKKENTDAVWDAISRRFGEIISGLGLSLDLSEEFQKIKKELENGADIQYAASRGEALNGRVVAALLDAEYIDAAEVIRIGSHGKNDPVSYEKIRARCADPAKRYVIPGFYGADSSGKVMTFSRGGSDVTGAVVANALNADIYENWTDVSGVLTCDPRIVDNPRPVKEISYQELRDLSYMGAGVLHEDAIFPVREKNIPINVRNTNRPQDEGTLILGSRQASSGQKLTGISGVKEHSLVRLEKAMLKETPGFLRNVLAVFEAETIGAELVPMGVDNMAVVIKNKSLGSKENALLEKLKALNPDHLEIEKDLSLIAAVGQNITSEPAFSAALFRGLANENIPVRLIDLGASNQYIIVGVDDKNYEKALRVIYKSLIEEGF